ncbi:uncharacterized protein LOC126821122 [Patella vulgata]|uniref:uncharacterized protein LOC126821122 n=1 Tax=Patella vulgata TaxID=6465 RepID=UPI00218016A7|nr:uncharacterized protein LOC126821122 [Patella vulgata]
MASFDDENDCMVETNAQSTNDTIRNGIEDHGLVAKSEELDADNIKDKDSPMNVTMLSHTETKKEILVIKKELEKKKLKLMDDIDRLETQRLTLLESSSLTHGQILKQQQLMVFTIKDVCKDKCGLVQKHYEDEIFKLDKYTKEMAEQNAEVEDVINYISEAIDEAKADFLGDALMAVKLKTENGISHETTPPKLVYTEFKEGEIKNEVLSTMIGSMNVSGLTEDTQNIIVSKFMEGTMASVPNRLMNRTRGYSVESSSTQISSGDLSEQISVATQTDGEGEQGSLGISEGSIVFTVNVDDLENSLDRCMESTPINVKGLSWRLVVYKHWRDQLQLRLYYKNLEFIEKSVEYVEYGYTCKLVNHQKETWSICKKESHKIGRDAWWDSVISWSRLENPANGYVNNKWITVEAKITVEDVKFY